MKTTNLDTKDCYCVCHSTFSSNAYCDHCEGDNVVGRLHGYPKVKEALTDSNKEEK